MEEKINALLVQMKLEEKIALLAGEDTWRTVPIERLGIPAIQVSDGPNGVRGADDNVGETSICFPVGVAMAATWNPDLIFQVGEALAKACRRKGAHVLLAPTVNIPRTPIAGRNFECFSEDPFLSGMIASGYISGLQSLKVAACLKHFVANDQEHERFSISAEVAAAPLHEIYLEPFRIAIKNANPWSIMSAYNRVNGTYASENDTLLRDILKQQWGYDGVVISDWYGTYSDSVPQGGLDLEMPGPARWMAAEKVLKAVQDGRLEEATIDQKVSRLLRLMFRVGALGDDDTPALPQSDDHLGSELTRRVAAESIVLLKNEGGVLPLDPKKPQTLAVIGENAKWAQIMGGGSSQVNPHYIISPLEGIKNGAGDEVEVRYQFGTPTHRLPPLLNPKWLATADGKRGGLTLEYFHNLDLSGEPAHKLTVEKSNLAWFGTANPYVDPKHFSLRLSGTLTVPHSGAYRLHLWTVGRSRLFVDGEELIDQWMEDETLDLADETTGDGQGIDQWMVEGNMNRTSEKLVQLTAHQAVPIVLEYVSAPKSVWRTVRLGCVEPLPDNPIEAAVDLAASADAAIVVAGLTHEWESEGFDRPDMRLPGQQDELIRRVAAANPNTVVVLNVGSPVEMPWVDEVPVILQSWYGGQEAGNGLADVLFGRVNPSGKLPITLPRRLEDNPAFHNYPGENGRVHYSEGIFVGYRHYDTNGITPLFPFGHGLSYTTFALSNLVVEHDGVDGVKTAVVHVDVTNTGERDGQEVVQLFVQNETSGVERPLRELKAFQKVFLKSGESKTVSLKLDEWAFAYFDEDNKTWLTQPGEYKLHIATASHHLMTSLSLAVGV